MVIFAQYCFYFVSHSLFRIIFRPKIVGAEHMPPRPFIIAANHTAKIDPFLLCLLPFSVIRQLIPIYFLTSSYYYRKWYLYPILKLLGCYPIVTRAWTLDEFLSGSFSKLNSGKTIMFFPEGKIVGENPEIKARPGIGYLGAKSGKLILPLRIRWDKNFLGIKQPMLLFGRPILIQPNGNNINFFEQESQKILDAIYSL